MIIGDLLRVTSTSAYVDLSTIEGRHRSMDLLIDLYMDILGTIIKPKTLVEIGAFDARFSIAARSRFPQAQIIAFEANPHNFEHFNDSVRSHGVDYRHLAISDKVGKISFELQAKREGQPAPKVKGSDTLLKRTELGIEYETVSVDTSTLDAQFADAQFSNDDFAFWVDVEGATELVFRGGPKTLERTQAIFIEVETRPFWANQWLLSNLMEFLYPLGFRLIAQDFENAHQFNVVFVRSQVTRHFMFIDRMTTYYNRLGQKV